MRAKSAMAGLRSLITVVIGAAGRSVMSPEYDAIIVGARCAGAPTAMLLAHKGYRVLLVDRATSRATPCPRTSSIHRVFRP